MKCSIPKCDEEAERVITAEDDPEYHFGFCLDHLLMSVAVASQKPIADPRRDVVLRELLGLKK